MVSGVNAWFEERELRTELKHPENGNPCAFKPDPTREGIFTEDVNEQAVHYVSR